MTRRSNETFYTLTFIVLYRIKLLYNLALRSTYLVRSPHHYGHPCSVPKCIPQCKEFELAHCNTVTLRTRLSRPVGDRNSGVPLYFIGNVAWYNPNVYNTVYVKYFVVFKCHASNLFVSQNVMLLSYTFLRILYVKNPI